MRIIKVAQVIGKWVGAGAENVIFNYFKYIFWVFRNYFYTCLVRIKNIFN